MNKTSNSNALSAYNNYISKTLNKTISSINISNNLTLIEHKFWNYLLFIAQQDISQQVYSTFIKEFNIFIGSTQTRQTHKKIIKIFESLLSKIINFIKETDTQFNKTTYVSSVKLENGIIYFEFSQNFKDNLIKINLDNNKINPYVSLNLDALNEIKSKHTITLYEFLNSKIFATKEVIVDVDYLREILSPNIYYSIFSRFNDKVLKNAIKEINEKTDLNIVKFEKIKSYDNKTVSKVRFIVEKQKINKEKDLNIDTTEQVATAFHQEIKVYPILVQELINIGVVAKKAIEMNAKDNQRLQAIFDEVQAKYADKTNDEKSRLVVSMFNNGVYPNFVSPTEQLEQEQKAKLKQIEIKNQEQQYLQQEKQKSEKEIIKQNNREMFENELKKDGSQLAQIWKAITKAIELNIPSSQVKTWFNPAIAKIEANTLNIVLPNRFKLDFFKNNLLRYVNQALHNINVNINVKVSL